MPKIKFNHVISFSSEDSVHNASNIISNDCTKKWKCQKAGEKAAIIVLQLEKASVISEIDIGNEHSAYVEVLVNRSSLSDDFKVLVVMSSFMTPLESRQSLNINKVRMFNYADLRTPERTEKWDQIKIVCTQPFNKHVQYGLSFINLHSFDANVTTPVLTQTKIGNFTVCVNSPDNIPAGNLFARRKDSLEETDITAAATIRNASSLSVSNQSILKYTPLKFKNMPLQSKTNESSNYENCGNQNEPTCNEDRPDAKIVNQTNRKQKNQLKVATEQILNEKDETQSSSDENVRTLDQQNNKGHLSIGISCLNKSKRKLNENDITHKRVKPNSITKPFNELLSGVIIVISGIENPERSSIRDRAISMGAKYKSKWDNSCTHLVCAFTNTPKYNQVIGKGKIVNAMWVNDCASQHKRLPWRRYALDFKDDTKVESEDEICGRKEEPQNIIRYPDAPTNSEDEAERNCTSEAVMNTVNIYCNETDNEDITFVADKNISESTGFFFDKCFYIDQEFSKSTRERLTSFVRKHKGSLVDVSSCAVDYAIAKLSSFDALKALFPDAIIVTAECVCQYHVE